MIRAEWQGKIIAESENTTVIEGNHYFPAESVHMEFLEVSTTHTVCPWKGTASYMNVVVDGKSLDDACWYYPDPTPEARAIRGHFAFWKGVTIG
ncbi:MAG: DUF427 domain-containing protein [Spirochaetota bacterium]